MRTTRQSRAELRARVAAVVRDRTAAAVPFGHGFDYEQVQALAEYDQRAPGDILDLLADLAEVLEALHEVGEAARGVELVVERRARLLDELEERSEFISTRGPHFRRLINAARRARTLTQGLTADAPAPVTSATVTAAAAAPATESEGTGAGTRAAGRSGCGEGAPDGHPPAGSSTFIPLAIDPGLPEGEFEIRCDGELIGRVIGRVFNVGAEREQC